MPLFHDMIMNGAGPLNVSYITSQFSSSSLTTYTFNNVSFGDPQSDRLIILSITWGIFSGSLNASSATIGGVSATIATQNDGTNTGGAIVYAVVPSGTTGTVTITLNSGAARLGFFVHRVVNYKSTTPTATSAPAGGGLASRSVTLTNPAGGFSLAFAYAGEAVGTWTNATSDASRTETSFGMGVARFSSDTEVLNRIITNSSCRGVVGAAWN